MLDNFRKPLFDTLYTYPDHHLTAIIELTRLPEGRLVYLIKYLKERAWSVFHEQEFSHLMTYGACLCTHRPDADMQGKSDFYAEIAHQAAEAVCGWIVSPLPGNALNRHLVQANRVIAPDGNRYLLRFHTEQSLRLLHARQDIPGIAEWWAPIQTWWFPLALHGRQVWSYLSGHDRLPQADLPRLELDQACWEALADDPLALRLTDQLKPLMTVPGKQPPCHTVRLAMVRQHLAKARELGLCQQPDLADYVTCMVLHGASLAGSPAWQQALDDARGQVRPLLQALHAHLKPLARR